MRGDDPFKMASFFLHPLTTFIAGSILSFGAIGGFLASRAEPNTSEARVSIYRDELGKAATGVAAADSPEEIEGVKRFTTFLENIGSAQFIRANTSKTYSGNAYLNDTLTTHRGAADIEKYFLKTSGSMTSCSVTIDDVARSGPDHYIRWTMVVAAPALSKGQPVHSTGISQVRFDRDGKVALHQDFWDSGENFFGKLPVAGGVIGFIRKRLE